MANTHLAYSVLGTVLSNLRAFGILTRAPRARLIITLIFEGDEIGG